jgi:drug/metabolite transporter (DMT)-like permease
MPQHDLKNRLKGTVLLLLAALIWGFAFVAQSIGMDYIGPFTFSASRSLIGALALLPFALLANKNIGRENIDGKKTIAGGLVCGAIIFVATNLQQMGLIDTSAGKAGFITSFYIVLVPVAGIFMKKRAGLATWAAVGIAVAGLYLLCIKPEEGFGLARGDLLVFLCALVFTAHIIAVDIYAPQINGIMLSCLQFAVSGVLSLVAALIFERPDLPSLCRAWLPVLYTGVLSSGAAYTFQILGQRRLPPAAASLIMSLESVFSVLAGWLMLRQSLSVRELAGCGLMFAAIVLVQCLPAISVGRGAKAKNENK